MVYSSYLLHTIRLGAGVCVNRGIALREKVRVSYFVIQDLDLVLLVLCMLPLLQVLVAFYSILKAQGTLLRVILRYNSIYSRYSYYCRNSRYTMYSDFNR